MLINHLKNIICAYKKLIIFLKRKWNMYLKKSS